MKNLQTQVFLSRLGIQLISTSFPSSMANRVCRELNFSMMVWLLLESNQRKQGKELDEKRLALWLVQPAAWIAYSSQCFVYSCYLCTVFDDAFKHRHTDASPVSSLAGPSLAGRRASCTPRWVISPGMPFFSLVFAGNSSGYSTLCLISWYRHPFTIVA